MCTKHKELLGVEAMMSIIGADDKVIKAMAPMFDKIYEMGLATGYKKGRQDEILSQMMGESNE